MSFEHNFDKLWSKQEFHVPTPKATKSCPFGRHFAEWVSPIVDNAAQIGTVYAINIALLRVTHKYFEWRTVVPKNHRNHIGDRGHTCIFHVYETAFLKLKMLELAIQPPPITVPMLPPPPPAPPPPPPPMQIAGIFLGEEEDN